MKKKSHSFNIQRILTLIMAAILLMSTINMSVFALGDQDEQDPSSAQINSTTEELESVGEAVTHTVTFNPVSDAVFTVDVVEGNTVTQPANPAVPEGKASFIGWYLGETAYDFSTPVTADITLVAKFHDKWLVSFTDADGDVFDTKEVTDGLTVTPTAKEFAPPGGKVFGSWYLGVEEYDFSTPVKSNLTLTPHFLDTHYMYFISKGSSVAHQLVTDGQKATKPTDPSGVGYTFTHWSLTEDGPAFDFNTSISADTTLYGVWTGQSVNYTIVYWLEKPNIDGDPGTNPANYIFNKSVTENAIAGSTVTPTAESLEAVAYAQFSHANSAVISGSGTTVVNVYFKRTVYTVKFNLNLQSNNDYYRNHRASLTKDDETYTAPTMYEINVKYEQDISNLWPLAWNATITQEADIWEKTGGMFGSWKADKTFDADDGHDRSGDKRCHRSQSKLDDRFTYEKTGKLLV